MLITKISGGLGNQMFQYAAGLSLSLASNKEIYLDISDYNEKSIYNFQLNDAFCINSKYDSNIVRQRVIKSLASPLLNNLYAKKVITKLFTSDKLSIVYEPHFHYWKEFHNLNKNVYLIGYWQTEKYFKKISPYVKSLYIFNDFDDYSNRKLQEYINRNLSISIHFRRGDYISNPSINRIHGTCPLEYYHSSIKFFQERFENISFILFSDNPDSISSELFIGKSNVKCVTWNGGSNSWKDMALMSYCNHHVIANSTFSWWGAWLSDKNGKIIISPKRWFNDASKNVNDIIPDGWLRF